jgi:folate-binding Fe-S cluster repair protein YgfZ
VSSSSRDGLSFAGKESRTYSKWKTWRLYKMSSRGVIRLKDVDIVPFLQGMVTNDVSQLVGDRESMYTMMLNPQVCHSW